MTNNTLAALAASNLRAGGMTVSPTLWADAAVNPGTALAAAIEAGVLEAVPQADGSMFVGTTAKGCLLVNEARESGSPGLRRLCRA